MMLDDEPCLGCDEPQHRCTCTRAPSPHRYVPAPNETPLTFGYTNHRRETFTRRILPRRVWWGSTVHYRTARWLIEGFDLDRGELRTFDLQRIVGIPMIGESDK